MLKTSSLSIFRFFKSRKLAKEALITEVGIREEEKKKRKAATASEVSAAEPQRKAPCRSAESSAAASSSFVSLYDEILEESVVESRPESASSALTQVACYLAEQTIPGLEDSLTTTALQQQPSFYVHHAQVWTARVSLVQFLMRRENQMSADKAQMLVFIEKYQCVSVKKSVQ